MERSGRKGTDSRAWFAVAALLLLFALPDGFRDGAFRPKELRFSGDLLALLTLAAVSYCALWGKYLRVLLLGYACLLCVARIDRVIVRQIMYEEPLLYDQLFMAQHLFVLIADLWSLTMAAAACGVGLTLAGIVWLCRRSLSVARTLLGDRGQRTAEIGLAIWVVALMGSASDALGLSKEPMVQWTSPLLVDNVRESAATYREVRKSFRESPYKAYNRVKLSKHPDIHLYIVESYGRVIWDERSMGSWLDPLLARLEQRMSDAGVQAVSAFSTSNVKGARSWLADGALMMGIPVRYEATFAHALRYAHTHPTLVSFLKQQGYETVLVAPADRPRLGLNVENRYGFDRLVTFDTLKYRGRKYGWGIIPDQHTIGFVREEIVARATRPQFINFHLVTSHAPWMEVPTLVEDWRSLSQGVPIDVSINDHRAGAFRAVGLRYDRVDNGINFRPSLNKYVRGYMQTLKYDLELIAQEIMRETERARLTVVIGDHQPPLITSLASSYDAPIHVFTRDGSLLEELRAQGFESGLRLQGPKRAVMGHAGMFSLLVRSLVRAGGGAAELPPLLRGGLELTPKRNKKSVF